MAYRLDYQFLGLWVEVLDAADEETAVGLFDLERREFHFDFLG